MGLPDIHVIEAGSEPSVGRGETGLKNSNTECLGRKGRVCTRAGKMPERWKEMRERHVREAEGREQNGQLRYFSVCGGVK